MENKKNKKIVVWILIILAAVIIITTIVLTLIPLIEIRNNAKINGSNDWMKNVDGTKYLNEISIPGTHDSGANYVQLGVFSKCQASDIKTQLNDGFRYLDIRLGVEIKDDKEMMCLYHGFCHCRTTAFVFGEYLYLDNVLKDCYEFLDENPSETIIFVVSNERDYSITDFQRILNNYINENRDYWYLSNNIPCLNQCRGKIVLARRYLDTLCLGDDAGIGIYWSDQGGRSDTKISFSIENTGIFNLVIQDRYKYTSNEKWEAFISCFQCPQQENNTLIINFLSTNGSVKYGHPYKYAKVLNEKLIEMDFEQYNLNNDSFWVIVDFSNALLAEKVYSLNF